MALTHDDLYLRLGHMIAEMPELDGSGPVPKEINEWLARALAVVELVEGGGSDPINMRVAMQHLSGPMRSINAQTIRAVVLSAFARAELHASPGVQGQFIPASSPHQAFVAVGKVLRLASKVALIVDAYADATALSDYAVQASEGVAISLLTDSAKRKPDLDPAIKRWREQYSDRRPLTVALAQPYALHDRLIIIDGKEVWTLGQSLNGVGKSSPTGVYKVPAESAREKLQAYQHIWDNAQKI